MARRVRAVVRRAVRLARRALRARAQPPPARPWQPGLPPGLEPGVLDGVVRARAGDPAGSPRHQHLSGWKSTGAFRVAVPTGRGEDTLVFKDARYDGHARTLEGLDLRPGPAEFAVYGYDRGCLPGWLPRVCWREEVLAGRHYRYLLEDLAPRFAPASGAAAVLGLCDRLPELHGCLGEALGTHGQAWLLRYDAGFASALLPYAVAGLEGHPRRGGARRVRAVLRRWGGVEAAYRQAQDEVLGAVAPVTLHGDLNLANVLSARDGSGELRLLDWEWAGAGIPHFDLAALLKRADPGLERAALERYAAAAGDHAPCLHWRAYQWCKLQRGLFDAGFLTRRAAEAGGRSEIDLDRHVELAAGRALAASRSLAGRPGAA